FFSSRRRHTRLQGDWSSDVCSSDLSAHIITAERGGELLALSRSDPQSAESLLRKAQRLASALRMAFEALLHRHRIVSEWVAPVRSEERRVGKECRSRGWRDEYKKDG